MNMVEYITVEIYTRIRRLIEWHKTVTSKIFIDSLPGSDIEATIKGENVRGKAPKLNYKFEGEYYHYSNFYEICYKNYGKGVCEFDPQDYSIEYIINTKKSQEHI